MPMNNWKIPGAWTVGCVLVSSLMAMAQDKGDPDDHIAWGKAGNGLKIGIAIDTDATEQSKLPIIKLYLVNSGDHDISGVIRSAARCVVVLNGIHYATEDYGGKSSPMPPGRHYGPIEIDFREFHQLPPLTDISHLTAMSVDVLRHGPLPKLRKGKNTISVYFNFGGQDQTPAHSGDVVFAQLE